MAETKEAVLVLRHTFEEMLNFLKAMYDSAEKHYPEEDKQEVLSMVKDIAYVVQKTGEASRVIEMPVPAAGVPKKGGKAMPS